MFPPAARNYYREQVTLGASAASSASHYWALMGSDFDSSWAKISSHVAAAVSMAQFNTATRAIAYIPKLLTETTQPHTATLKVQAVPFAGVAGDGRSLDTLLYSAVTNAKLSIQDGASISDALARGRRWLQMGAISAVADAGRAAIAASIAIENTATGWVRMLEHPSCPRCTLLASRWYEWHEAIERHPRDNCIQVPMPREVAGTYLVDPAKYFDSLDQSEQDQLFGPGPAAKIRQGTPIQDVINTRHGAMTTQSLTGGPMTVERILTSSKDNRSRAMELLRAHGFAR